MISIDTVYQRVLALANKEQRGYITPQDFNLFANQAQMEIFEQYFYDVNMARKGQGNDTVYGDVDDMLEQKMQIFERVDDSTAITANYASVALGLKLPIYIYKIYKVLVNNKNAEILNAKDFSEVKYGPRLITPNLIRPVANIMNNEIRCYANSTITPSEIHYFKKPDKVNWAYIVMNEKAMYNQGAQVDFELHRSEETQLVNKILKLSGISIKQQDVAQAGQGMEAFTIQQQPKI